MTLQNGSSTACWFANRKFYTKSNYGVGRHQPTSGRCIGFVATDVGPENRSATTAPGSKGQAPVEVWRTAFGANDRDQ